jgi:hypothetical protein
MRRIRRALDVIWQKPGVDQFNVSLNETSQASAVDVELQNLLNRVNGIANNPDNHRSIADFLGRLLPRFAEFYWGQPTFYHRFFNQWQDAGFSLLPSGEGQPVPHVNRLSDAELGRQFDMSHMYFAKKSQTVLLKELIKKFGAETRDKNFGASEDFQFSFGNHVFEAGDAEIFYAYMRQLAPKRVVQVGPGPATRLIADVLRRNGGAADFTVIERARAKIDPEVQGVKVIEHDARQVDPAVFGALTAGDVLVIDTDHVVTPGSLADYMLSRIIPNLNPGVLIHMHPIFLPKSYPVGWVRGEHVFWNEQDFLATFLSFNNQFEIVLAANALSKTAPELLGELSSRYQPMVNDPGGFWFRRVT